MIPKKSKDTPTSRLQPLADRQKRKTASAQAARSRQKALKLKTISNQSQKNNQKQHRRQKIFMNNLSPEER